MDRIFRFRDLPVNFLKTKTTCKGGFDIQEFLVTFDDGTPVDRFNVFRYIPHQKWTAWTGDSISLEIHKLRDQWAESLDAPLTF